MHTLAKTGAAVSGVLLTALAAAPASAASKPVIDLHGSGVGSFVMDGAGSAHLSGSVSGVPFDGTYTAVLSADDGSLPESGGCEPATATLHATGSRGRYLQLAALGTVCGEWPSSTYVVTHRFTGRYVVTDASSRRLRGTDGWMSQILATQARANVEMIDT